MKIKGVGASEHNSEIFKMDELQEKLTGKYCKDNYDVSFDHKIVTRSPIMKEVHKQINRVIDHEGLPVFLEGETGTGKELVARAIHDDDEKRKDKNFVAVNCAAIPESLFESELFGHEKGAYTGAKESREGKFRAANGGTLFLDEIGTLPKKLQEKFLRVLESREVVPVGSDFSEEVDVRLIFATSSNLKKRIENEDFSKGLFYRINAVKIHLPPLRERMEDIPLLTDWFLGLYISKWNILEAIKIDKGAYTYLSRLSWPGNVRQLSNTVLGAAVFRVKDTLTKTVFEKMIKTYNFEERLKTKERLRRPDIGNISIDSGRSFTGMVKGVERKLIYDALERSRGNQVQASKILGITRDILRYRMKQYEFSSERWSGVLENK